MSSAEFVGARQAVVPPRAPVADASAWRSADLADDPRWIRLLGAAELAEIEPSSW